MISYLRIETLKKHTLSDGTYSISSPPQPHPRKGFVLTQAYKVLSILNGGNVTDGMTPGFKQVTVNILVMKIISLH